MLVVPCNKTAYFFGVIPFLRRCYPPSRPRQLTFTRRRVCNACVFRKSIRIRILPCNKMISRKSFHQANLGSDHPFIRQIQVQTTHFVDYSKKLHPAPHLASGRFTNKISTKFVLWQNTILALFRKKHNPQLLVVSGT